MLMDKLFRNRPELIMLELRNKTPFKTKIDLKCSLDTLLFIVVFIGLWQLAYLSGIWPQVSLPSPIMVVESFYELILDNTL